jgi:hypothetical protein
MFGMFYSCLVMLALGDIFLFLYRFSFVSWSRLAATNSLALQYVIKPVHAVQQWLQLNGKHPVLLYRCTVYTNKHSASGSLLWDGFRSKY